LVAGLLEPFITTKQSDIFQWLSGKEAIHGLDVGEISLLITSSPTGQW
jgi:hypothetical protein